MSAVKVDAKTAGLMPQVMKALNEPFEPGCVGWKPGKASGNKAIALAYIDARDVMDRLDSLVSKELLDGWRDEYEPLQAGAVRCRLFLCVAGQWIAKEDVGGASAQPDPGDKVKAAFSDALKRAAVKWGVGRYLYHLDAAWVDFDPQRKCFTRKPTLPAWALPGGSGRPPSYSLPPHLAAEAHPDPEPTPPPDQKSQAAAVAAEVGMKKGTEIKQPPPKSPPPASGKELHARVREFDAKLAGAKRCPVGALLAHVAQAGAKAGYGDDVSRWDKPEQIAQAVEWVKAFDQAHPGGK